MWVYIESEPGLYTVGFHTPDGKWHTDSDQDDREKAANRVNFLNGGYRVGHPQDENVPAGLPVIIPIEDMQARRDSTRRHIIAAIEVIEPMTFTEPKGDLLRAGIDNAKISLDSNELLLAWEDVYDAVLNSGGEPHDIRPPNGFWFHMAEAARLMIKD